MTAMRWSAPTTPVVVRSKARAKTLRRDLTDAEQTLWHALKHQIPLADTHFRKQMAIGPYIVDFVCLKHRLIVEVDGEQHAFETQRKYDEKRSAYLQGHGFRLLRFWNHEVMREIDSVVDTIFAELFPTTPTPDPSPQGGGEQIAACDER